MNEVTEQISIEDKIIEMAFEHSLNIDRRGFIGGSDGAAAIGASDYKSQRQLWKEKTAPTWERPELKSAQAEKILIGILQEEPVAKMFTMWTGIKVRRDNRDIVHPDYPFIQAHVDRVGKDSEGKRFILECKNNSEYRTDEWKDGNVPPDYSIQGLHYLACCPEAQYVRFAVLLGGNHLVYDIIIERDEELISDYLTRVSDFWNNHVLPKVEPPVMLLDEPEVNAVEVTNDELLLLDEDEYYNMVKECYLLNETKKQAEKAYKEKNIVLRDIIAGHKGALCGDLVVKFGSQNRMNFLEKKFKDDNPDWATKYGEQKTIRVFEIVPAKGVKK